MTFDKNLKKTRNPENPRKQTMTNVPTNMVPSNIPVIKNKFGVPPRYHDLVPSNPVIHRDDGTFSPIPPDFRYSVRLKSHYPESSLDWGEPSFGFGIVPSEDDEHQNIPAEQNNPPLQDFNPLNYNKSHLDNPTVYRKQTAPTQGNIQVHKPAPARALQNNRYSYSSLESALNFWIRGLKIGDDSKKVYRSRVIKFVRLLDANGVYNPSQAQIKAYCDQTFRPTDHDNIRYFNLVAGGFFKWVNDRAIYNKIKPHGDAP